MLVEGGWVRPASYGLPNTTPIIHPTCARITFAEFFDPRAGIQVHWIYPFFVHQERDVNRTLDRVEGHAYVSCIHQKQVLLVPAYGQPAWTLVQLKATAKQQVVPDGIHDAHQVLGVSADNAPLVYTGL